VLEGSEQDDGVQLLRLSGGQAGSVFARGKQANSVPRRPGMPYWLAPELDDTLLA
jgi:hypothetical protein